MNIRKSLLTVLAPILLGACGLNQPCSFWNPVACSPPPTCAGLSGAGGDDGTGGDDGAGGDGLGGGTSADVGVGASPGSSADVGVGAGPGSSDVSAGAGAGPGARSPRGRGQRVRHHRSRLGAAAQADCAGVDTPPPTPMMAPKPPNLQPFTTMMLRQVAAANNIGLGQKGVTQSRTIGLAFELWVLTAMQQLPRNQMSFMSPQRQTKNSGGLPASVIPEFVASLGLWWMGRES